MNHYDEIRTRHETTIIESVAENLRKRDFEAVVLNSTDAVRQYIESEIQPDQTVGFGGSVTIRELGLDALLRGRGNTVFDHWDANLSPDERLSTRRRQLDADCFITGSNAITRDGRIVNIDGIGNRVAAMIFGPRRVIAIVGANKIARDLDDAIWRIKNIASPRNSMRLNMDTPCARTGACVECSSRSSVCRVTTIIDYRPSETRFTVILLPVPLGF